MIIDQAKSRWPLAKVTVIHRVGRMLPTENIVFVGCSSAHREAAFDGANFIMDFLQFLYCIANLSTLQYRLSD